MPKDENLARALYMASFRHNHNHFFMRIFPENRKKFHTPQKKVPEKIFKKNVRTPQKNPVTSNP